MSESLGAIVSRLTQDDDRPKTPEEQEQRVRYWCMTVAINSMPQSSAEKTKDIVDRAQQFYDFINGKQRTELKAVK